MFESDAHQTDDRGLLVVGLQVVQYDAGVRANAFAADGSLQTRKIVHATSVHESRAGSKRVASGYAAIGQHLLVLLVRDIVEELGQTTF